MVTATLAPGSVMISNSSTSTDKIHLAVDVAGIIGGIANPSVPLPIDEPGGAEAEKRNRLEIMNLVGEARSSLDDRLRNKGDRCDGDGPGNQRCPDPGRVEHSVWVRPLAFGLGS